MRLTSFTDFGLRALMRIASAPDRPHSTAEIAAEFGVSRHHLTKAMAALAAAGVLATRRGQGGGAMLARAPETVRLGDVVATLERGTALVECFASGGGACTVTPTCRLKGLLAAAEAEFIDALNRHSLADIALPRQEDTQDDNQR